MPIQFNSSLGAIVANTQYWILTIANSTTITITATYGSGTTLTTGSAASGSITATAGGGYETCGTGTYNNVLSTINGAEILRANKTFLSNEATAYVSATYTASVTSTTASTGIYNFVCSPI